MKKRLAYYRYKTANLFLKQGKYLEAVEVYREVVEMDPLHFKAYSNLGVVLKRLDMLSEAITMFERSLKIKARQPVVYNNLGNIFTSQKEYKKAVAAYKTAIQLDPLYQDAYHNLGSVLYFTGKTGEALDLLTKYEELRTGKSVSVKRKTLVGFKG